jgi:alkylated DNA repair protein (DNA oxidative demethylase)
VNAAELSPFRFHGWLGKRLTASYGWRYDFDDASFAATGVIPDWLLPLRATAAEVRLDAGKSARFTASAHFN